MRIFYAIIACCLFLNVSAQEMDEEGGKGKVNYELVGGLAYSVPVGVYFKGQRSMIKDKETANPNYSGTLLPKTGGYTGLLVDYKFHKVGAIGFGLRYAPEGWWLFEEENGVKSKSFHTVDYIQMPIFFQEYFYKGKMTVRWGPVFSFAAITKVRKVTIDGDQKEKEVYRYGEKGFPAAKEMVPGFEFAYSYGNNLGAHVTAGIKYDGSMFHEWDAKSFTAFLGFGYTFSN